MYLSQRSSVPIAIELTVTATMSLTLTMDPDHPANTTFYTENGTILYTVSTRRIFGDKRTAVQTFTDVHNTYDELIATLEWRDLLSDKAVLKDKGEITVGSWLRKSIIGRYLSEPLSMKSLPEHV